MMMGFNPAGMGFSDVDLMITGIIKTCKHHNIKVTPNLRYKYVKQQGPTFQFHTLDDMVMARFVF